jgi:hypothetical protein
MDISPFHDVGQVSDDMPSVPFLGPSNWLTMGQEFAQSNFFPPQLLEQPMSPSYYHLQSTQQQYQHQNQSPSPPTSQYQNSPPEYQYQFSPQPSTVVLEEEPAPPTPSKFEILPLRAHGRFEGIVDQSYISLFC